MVRVIKPLGFDKVIEDATDALLSTDLVSGYDWVGTGEYEPSDAQIRAVVRAAVVAVLQSAVPQITNRVRGISPFLKPGYRAGRFVTASVLAERLDAIDDASEEQK